MMNISHGLSGAAAGAWLAVALEPSPAIALVGTGVATLTALAPDLDHPSARPTKALGPVGWLLCRLIRFVSELTTGLAHRGLSHSIAFAVLVGVLVGVVSGQWLPVASSVYLAVSASLGVVAALLGDLVTASGLNHLLWPSQVKVSIPKRMRIDTGGWVEVFFVRPAVTALTLVGLGLILTGGVGG